MKRNKKDLSTSTYQDENKTRSGKSQKIGNKSVHLKGDTPVMSDVSQRSRSTGGEFIENSDKISSIVKNEEGVNPYFSDINKIMDIAKEIRFEVEEKGKITKKQSSTINNEVISPLIDMLTQKKISETEEVDYGEMS